MKQCPACLPPDNATCATCSGSWSVSEEVSAEFLAKQGAQDDLMEFSSSIFETLRSAETVEEAKLAVQVVLEQYSDTLDPSSS